MLQLNQLGDSEDEKDIPDIYHWAQLFKAKTWEEIQMLAQKNDDIQQSIHTLQELTADEEMRMKMEARERYRMDFEAAVDYQKQKIQQQLDALQAENVKKDEQLSQKDEQLSQKDEQLSQKNEQLFQKDKQLSQKDEQLSQKDEQLSQKDERIRILEEQIAKLTQK